MIKNKSKNKESGSIAVNQRGENDTILLNSNGVVPIGGILCWAPGFVTATDNTGFTNFVNGSSSIDVATANKHLSLIGFRVCDGTALNIPSSPIWNAANRYLPNISGERFLRGSTVIGGTGGQNTMIDHTHSVAITAATSSHYHTWGNCWSNDNQDDFGVASGNGDGSQNTYADGIDGVTKWHNNIVRWTVWASDMSHSHWRYHSRSAASGTYRRWDINAVVGAENAYPIGHNTLGSNVNLNHSHIWYWPTHRHWIRSRSTEVGVHNHGKAGSFGSGSAPAATENRPKYMNCFFIIRVD